MEIIHKEPPMLQAILDAGMAPRLSHALFAYGDELYIPGGFTPSEEVMRHEETHSHQHAEYEGGRDAWWARYLDDPYFRIREESEAYAVQYNAFCDVQRDRNRRALYLMQLAGHLSGPMYGNVIGSTAAKKMILEQA